MTSVGKPRLVVWCLVASACGHIDFDNAATDSGETGPVGPVAFVQSTGLFHHSAPDATSPQLATSPEIGHRIVVSAWSFSKAAIPDLTATDTAGNTYTVDAQVNFTDDVGTGLVVVTILSAPVVATVAGFDVTVHSAGSTGAIDGVACEFSGLAAVDQSNTSTGTTPSASVSTAQVVAAGELVVSAVNIASPGGEYTSITPAPGYSPRAFEPDNESYEVGEAADLVVTASGVKSDTWISDPTAVRWLAAIVAYR